MQKDAMDAGGVGAYDASEYKRWIKKSGYYECNVTIGSFDCLRFAHAAIPPALGLRMHAE